VLIQVVLNTLISTASIALVASGFSIIYATGRFFHFAHGAVFATAGYCVYLCTEIGGWPLGLSLPTGIAAGTGLGLLMELCVYRPLRRKRASRLVLLLSSLGLLIVLQNTISLAFGDGTKILWVSGSWESFPVWEGRLTAVQAFAIVGSAALSGTLLGMIGLTRLGRTMRAVAEDRDLAWIVGVDCDQTILLSMGLGSLLAATAGTLVALDTGCSPMMGFSVLFLGVVAAVVGGVGSASGAIWGALLVATVQNLGALVFPTQWQDAIVFSVLILFLLLRPQGITGCSLTRGAL